MTAGDDREVAVRLFYAVRDGFRYDPYNVDHAPEKFRASSVVAASSNWCVPKSVLLTAAARSQGIPARLGFADVKNHLTSEKLKAQMHSDVFAWHGYSELLLGDRWHKLSTAFNIELCDKFGVQALDFDGTGDALMHPFDKAGNRHMEYINQRGSFDDLPLERILADFAEIYGDFVTTPRRGARQRGRRRRHRVHGLRPPFCPAAPARSGRHRKTGRVRRRGGRRCGRAS